MGRHLLLRTLTAAAIMAAAQSAGAQGGGEKRAEDLFRDAKQDVEAGRFDEACPKFEASYRVSDNPGALLSWADCEEKRDKLATALRLWEQGATKVASDADRSRYVAGRVAALKPRVPLLVVEVAPGPTNVVVKLDGEALDLAKGPFSVDPGDRVIVATADGLPPETQSVTAKEGTSQTVVVFAPKPPPKTEGDPPPKPSTEEKDDGSALKIAGFVVGGVGLAGAVAFGATAGVVVSRCDQTGFDSDGKALDGNGCPEGSRGLLIGNAVALGIGAAGLAVGTVLLIVGYTRSDEDEVVFVPGPGDVGAGLSWSFQ
jgi:hypothetical protein